MISDWGRVDGNPDYHVYNLLRDHFVDAEQVIGVNVVDVLGGMQYLAYTRNGWSLYNMTINEVNDTVEFEAYIDMDGFIFYVSQGEWMGSLS